MVATERKTAEVRREEILAAALEEFGEHGLHGTSTDTIAEKAGVSQPYLFRLFGTKKELYLESVRRCLRRRGRAGGRAGRLRRARPVRRAGLRRRAGPRPRLLRLRDAAERVRL